MAAIHDRMPVILPPSAWEAWLDRDNHDIEALGRLLVPAPEGLLALHPVSTDVSNVRNVGPHLIDEVETIDPDGKARRTAGDRPSADPGPAGSAGSAAADSGQASLFDPGR